MDIIKLLIQNSDGLGFAIAIVTLVYSILSSRQTNSLENIKERHGRLISPMFFLIEPYLFQSIDNSSLERLFDLIDQNQSLVDGKLLEVAYFCKENPSQYNYNKLCSYINRSYDKSCKRLGLKLRSIEYRLNRKQYKSKASLLFYFMIIVVKGALIFIASSIVVLSIVGLGIHWYENISSPENQIRVSFFFLIFLLILLNYLKDRN